MRASFVSVIFVLQSVLGISLFASGDDENKIERLLDCSRALSGNSPSDVFQLIEKDDSAGLLAWFQNLSQIASPEAYSVVQEAFEYAADGYISSGGEKGRQFRGIITKILKLAITSRALKIDPSLSYLGSFFVGDRLMYRDFESLIELVVQTFDKVERLPLSILPFFESLKSLDEKWKSESDEENGLDEEYVPEIEHDDPDDTGVLVNKMIARLHENRPGLKALTDEILSKKNQLNQLRVPIQNLMKVYSDEAVAGDVIVEVFVRSNSTEVWKYLGEIIPQNIQISKSNQNLLAETAMHHSDSDKRRYAEQLLLKTNNSTEGL